MYKAKEEWKLSLSKNPGSQIDVYVEEALQDLSVRREIMLVVCVSGSVKEILFIPKELIFCDESRLIIIGHIEHTPKLLFINKMDAQHSYCADYVMSV
jgi:hypothetical protein